MKHIKNFEKFINEMMNWEEDLFTSHGEREVADIAEEELLTKNLVIIEEDDELFNKLVQVISTAEGEKVLEIDEHDLTKYSEPTEFIKWELLGSDSKPIETKFIIKTEDKSVF